MPRPSRDRMVVLPIERSAFQHSQRVSQLCQENTGWRAGRLIVVDRVQGLEIIVGWFERYQRQPVESSTVFVEQVKC